MMKKEQEIKTLRKKLLKIYGVNVDKIIRDNIFQKHKKRIGYIKVGKVLKGYEENPIVLEEAIILLKQSKKRNDSLINQIKDL